MTNYGISFTSQTCPSAASNPESLKPVPQVTELLLRIRPFLSTNWNEKYHICKKCIKRHHPYHAEKLCHLCHARKSTNAYVNPENPHTRTNTQLGIQGDVSRHPHQTSLLIFAYLIRANTWKPTTTMNNVACHSQRLVLDAIKSAGSLRSNYTPHLHQS